MNERHDPRRPTAVAKPVDRPGLFPPAGGSGQSRSRTSAEVEFPAMYVVQHFAVVLAVFPRRDDAADFISSHAGGPSVYEDYLVVRYEGHRITDTYRPAAGLVLRTTNN